MAHYETGFVSPKPIAEVFGYLADFTNATEWDDNTESVRCLTGDPLALGARYEVVTKFGGRTLTLVYETVTLEEPHRVVLQCESGPVRIEDTMTFAETAGGTEVHYRAQIYPKGPAKLLDPVFHLIFQAVGGRAAKGLKQALGAS